MGTLETSMGGSREGFPDTVGSVLSNPALSASERQARLEKLFSGYWRPVYAYLRGGRRFPIEDAKDLTQEFFRYLLDGDVLSRYRPDAGRFRRFLKGTLDNFLLKTHRDGSAQKRGGGAPVFSLDTADFDTDSFLRRAGAEEPDRLFKRQWAQEIVARGVLRLRTQLEAEGKAAHYRVYESQDLCPAGAERPSYEETARRLGISSNDVRNFLHIARTRLQQLIVQTVAEYSGSTGEIKEEMRDLFRGDGP